VRVVLLARSLALLAFVLFLLSLLSLQGCGSLEGGHDLDPEPSFRGHYRFNNPHADASLKLDSTYLISWSAADSVNGGPVRLSLYHGETRLGDLSTTLPASGSYAWNLGLSRPMGQYRFGSGTGYRLRITDASDTTRQAFSDTFTVVSSYSGSLILSAPAAGEIVPFDSSSTITWNMAGPIGNGIGIQVYRNTDLVATLGLTEPPWAERYDWRPSARSIDTGDGYRIRIFASANPTIAHLGPTFRITHTQRVNQPTAYRFLSPVAGDTVVAGDSITVAWASNGDTGQGNMGQVQLELYRDSSLATNLGFGHQGSDSLRFAIPISHFPGQYHFRVTSMTDAKRFAVSPAFTIKSPSGDSFEPDDTLLLAKSIATDGTKQNRTLVPGDTDWIRFEAVPGKRYLAEIWPPSFKNLILADSAGRELARGGEYHSRLNLNPTYTGQYLIRVAYDSRIPDPVVTYEATITAYDTAAPATNIALLTPAAQDSWTMGAAHSITWVPNRVAQGEMVSLELHDDFGAARSVAIYVDNVGRYDWDIPRDVQAWDRYHIRVRNMRVTDSSDYIRSAVFTIQAAP
jgi:Ser-Thr-rich glycosyl-phosphatidyl-inositol-anchored membrane family